MSVSGRSLAGYNIAGVLIFFGLLFLMSARGEYTANPGGRIITGLVLIAGGTLIAALAKTSRAGQKIEITQKIELSGTARPEEMKCRQCGAPLDKNSVEVKEGAVFINCPYCKGSYQIVEDPKW
jgi:DNA-directed RNA polymerase subunit RPC12/RpoP